MVSPRIRGIQHSVRRLTGALLSLGVLCFAASLFARPARADSWALLIGIDQYADSNRITSLGGAAADARALAKTLQESAGLPESHIQLLVSDGDAATRPTRVEILNALTRLAANAKAGDTVFVLYSGHGIEIGGTSYLLPYDTSPLSDADITDSAIETEKFTSRLRRIKARALVLAFDMCRSDPRKGARGVGGDTDNKLTRATLRGLDFARDASREDSNSADESIAVTFYSCSPDERSYEDRVQSRGYFSEFLEKGLRGGAADASGTVRVAGLAKYLEKNVHTAVALVENGASQTPYPEIKGPGAGEFALAHRSGSAAPISRAVDVEPPPISFSDKVVLRYRPRTGQMERIRETASLMVPGDLGRLNTTETVKATIVRVDSQSGEMNVKYTQVHMTESSSVGIHDTEIPETASLTLGANGKLVSVRSIQGNSEGDAGAARRRQAAGLFFPDKPVGRGDKWSHDYAANPALGTPAAHGDFEIANVSIADGVRRFTVKMSYTERGAAPIVSRGVYVIDPETGDLFSEDVEISGLVIAGHVLGGTLHSERLGNGE